MLTRLARLTLLAALFALAPGLTMAKAYVPPVTGSGLDTAFGYKGRVEISRYGFGQSQSPVACMVTPKRVILAMQGGKYKHLKGDYYPSFVPNREFLLAFDHKGRRDTSFGQGGVVRAKDLSYRSLFDRAVDSSGRILLLSASGNDKSGVVTIRRIGVDGRTDRSFDSDGKVTYPVTTASEFSLQTLPDGRIATVDKGEQMPTTVHIFSESGAPETSFGDGGSMKFDAEGGVVTGLPDGGIAFAGQIPTGVLDERALEIRILNSAGALNLGWGGTGRYVIARTPISIQGQQFPDEPKYVDSGRFNQIIPGALSLTADGSGLSFSAGAAKYSSADEGYEDDSLIWVGKISPFSTAFQESTAKFLLDTSPIFEPSSSDYNTHWARRVEGRGWLGVDYEYIDTGGMFANFVSDAGRSTETSFKRLDFHGETDVADIQALNKQRLLGCGSRVTGSGKRTTQRTFLFVERLKPPR